MKRVISVSSVCRGVGAIGLSSSSGAQHCRCKGDSGKRKTAKNDEDPAIIHTTYSPLVGILTNSKQSSTCGYVHNSDASVTQQLNHAALLTAHTTGA